MLARSLLFAGALAVCGFSAAVAAQGDDLALQQRLEAEEAELVTLRAAWPPLFDEAYAAYPQIPRGMLEAIAWSQTRWVPPSAPERAEGHHHMPTAWGVMGLYGGEGFADQLGAAGKLLGVPARQIAEEPRWNVLGAAALLAAEIDRLELDAVAADANVARLTPALVRYAGFSSANTLGASNIDSFARDSFAFDVLLSLDRGVNEKGAVVPETPVYWEEAFPADKLALMQAPFVRLDPTLDRIEADGYALDPRSETLVPTPGKDAAGRSSGSDAGDHQLMSTDYGPAIWSPASASNYTASRSQAISGVVIHTAEGSYAGTISWFKNPAAQVSAHYVIRSSDGQVTQMVRNAHMAWHARSANPYTLGIEHEGYVSSSSWYTTAMYNASAALVRNFCAKYGPISCASAYSGPAGSVVNVLPASVKIKGHQHYPGQTHTDPGKYWNWGSYYNLLNPGSGSTVKVLDNFESSVGHFYTSPTYSGSTRGVSTASTAQRYCSMAHSGNCSLQVKLVDDPATSAAWDVRLLSGAGNPANNVKLQKANNGRVGFWVYAAGSGMSAAVGIDDSDGTERSIFRAIPANKWTYLEWKLADNNQWNAWVGGNGKITAASVTLDAIWLRHANTSYTVYTYIDNVAIKN